MEAEVIEKEEIKMESLNYSSEGEKRENIERQFIVKGEYPKVGTGGMGEDLTNDPQYALNFIEAGISPTMTAVLIALGDRGNYDKFFGPDEVKMTNKGERIKFFNEQNKKVFLDRFAKVREKTPYGPVGVNLMDAVENYKEMLETIGTAGVKNEKGEVIEKGIDILYVGAGMPKDLCVDMLKYPHMKYVPIVGSARAAKFMMHFAMRNKGRMPDAFYVENPKKGGGHVRGEEFDAEEVVKEIRKYIKEYYGEGVHIPIILGGGISYREDIDQALAWGYDSVNIGTRALCTEPSGLPNKTIKEEYLTAKKVVINDASPTGYSSSGLPHNKKPNKKINIENPEDLNKISILAKQVRDDCFICLKKCKHIDSAKEILRILNILEKFENKKDISLKEIETLEKGVLSDCIAKELGKVRHGIFSILKLFRFSGSELPIIKHDELYRDEEGKLKVPSVQEMVGFMLDPKNTRYLPERLADLERLIYEFRMNAGQATRADHIYKKELIIQIKKKDPGFRPNEFKKRWFPVAA